MPILNDIKAETESCLYELRNKSKTFIVGEDKIIGSRNIQLARNQLVQGALSNKMYTGLTHLCMFDADMTFPEYALDYLVQADKDIIGVTYITRCKPLFICAFRYNEKKQLKPINIFNQPIEEVDAVGSGMVLIKKHVFDKMGKSPFSISGSCFTEDVEFCVKAREQGFKVYIDTRVRCGHIGEYKYTIEDVPEADFTYERQGAT
jgi:hypothetical protein